MVPDLFRHLVQPFMTVFRNRLIVSQLLKTHEQYDAWDFYKVLSSRRL